MLMTLRVPETGDVLAYTTHRLLARQPGTLSDCHVAGPSVRPASLECLPPSIISEYDVFKRAEEYIVAK